LSTYRTLMGRIQIFDKIFTLTIWVFIALAFILTFYPFYYVLVYSLNDPLRQTPGLMFWPQKLSLSAYRTILTSRLVHRAFFISVARSTVGPALSLIVTSMIAFPLSIRILPGRRVLNWYFLLTMYIGAGLIPTYLLYVNLGLNNTFWVYIVPSLVNVYGMILIRTYMESLPASLQESAVIDGAGYFRIFLQIVMPLCLPVLAAITLFSCVNQWNAYADTVIYNTWAEELHPLQYVLVKMITGLKFDSDRADAMAQAATASNVSIMTPFTMRLAVTVVTIVPITTVYPILQRYFIKGLMIGSIKG